MEFYYRPIIFFLQVGKASGAARTTEAVAAVVKNYDRGDRKFDRGGDRKYDRGGDRKYDRGGDRKFDRGGDRKPYEKRNYDNRRDQEGRRQQNRDRE